MFTGASHTQSSYGLDRRVRFRVDRVFLRNAGHPKDFLVHGVHVGISAKLRINLEELLEVVTIPVSYVSPFVRTVETAEHLVAEDRLDGFLDQVLFDVVTCELFRKGAADLVDERADFRDVRLDTVDTFVRLLVAVRTELVYEPFPDWLNESDDGGQHSRHGNQERRDYLQMSSKLS